MHNFVFVHLVVYDYAPVGLRRQYIGAKSSKGTGDGLWTRDPDSPARQLVRQLGRKKIYFGRDGVPGEINMAGGAWFKGRVLSEELYTVCHMGNRI